MKKILLAMSAVSAIALTAPAAAQYSSQSSQYPNQTDGRGGIEARIERLQARLRAGVQQGSIDRQEAWPLRRDLRQIEELHHQYAAGGLNPQERQDLQQRLREVRRQMRVADGGGYDQYDRDDGWRDDDRGYGQSDRIDRNNDGFDDRDTDRDGRWDDNVQDRDRIDRNNDGFDDRDTDRDGRWDDNAQDWTDRNNDGYDDRDTDRDGRWDDNARDRIDRDNDGYDDRDYDRDGRWDDDVNNRIDRNNDGYDDRDYDRDGRWDDDVQEGRGEQTQERGVIGTLLDTFLGGAGGLRVGQRAPDNLGGVPYAYRNQYRDGNGVYFRSDGRAIYEIDVRTRNVVRVHPIAR